MKSPKYTRREFLEKAGLLGAVAAGTTLLAPDAAVAAVAEVCTPATRLNAADEIIQNLRNLKNVWHGFPVDQLTHGLQTATLARRAGESSEMIVASLCHDMAKTTSAFNHEEMAAEMLKPYLSSNVYNMLKYHGIFQGRFFWDEINRDPDTYLQFRGQPWYNLAMKFTEIYDKPAFKHDVAFDSLETFIPLIKKVVGV